MSNRFGWTAIAVLLLASGAARAEKNKKKAVEPEPAAQAEPAADQPPAAPTEERALPWKEGPANIALGHDVSIALPAGFAFLEPISARKELEKMGNFHNESVLGIVAPSDLAKTYYLVIRFDDSGFVKDGDKLDADEILEALKTGQEEANKERVERGFKPLVVDGWAEPPRYEKERHHLVWAVRVHSDNGAAINFPTRILGRRGYVMVNLVVDPEHFAASKADMPGLLAATTFGPGARYEEFNPSTDKVAEYGLVALITGGVAMKVGLLAKFWGILVAVVLALKKALILVLIAVGAFLKRILGRRKDAIATEPPPDRGTST